MKSIKQQVTVEFNAVEFRDMLTILPIMDQLHGDMIYHIQLYQDREERNDPIVGEIKRLYRQYRVLSRLGFISSIPLIIPEELRDIVNEDKL